MSKLPLTLAISRYDHVGDLTSGRVAVEGIDLNCLDLELVDIFFRFLTFREFDVSEISFAKYASMISQGEDWLTALPVFPSRVFRHSCFYVRRDGPVRLPEDLAGRRVGLPEWAQTAAVYARGLLVHQYGVDLASIDWIQAGLNEAGRKEKVALRLPAGLRVTPALDKTLNDMLVSGEVDAVMSAHPPDCFAQGHPNVRRLFEEYMEVERDYFRATGIFPIMHTVAIKRDVLDRAPWVATSLFRGFEEARRRSLERAAYIGATRFPIPWGPEYVRRSQELFGADWWPYGIAANRRTLDAFLQYCFEQGVCHRRLEPEELFAPQVQQRGVG